MRMTRGTDLDRLMRVYEQRWATPGEPLKAGQLAQLSVTHELDGRWLVEWFRAGPMVSDPGQMVLRRRRVRGRSLPSTADVAAAHIVREDDGL